MSPYVPLLRRRRRGQTDYRARRRAIASQKPLLVVRVSNKNVSSQFVKPTAKGDLVVSSAHSRELIRLGWHGSLKSTPACYLLGMLAGKKAQAKGVSEAVLYMGVLPFIRGARMAAFVKGAIESGVQVPMGEEAFPSADQLSGKTISEYATTLSSEDAKAYSKRFSALLKAGFDPTGYPAQVEKTKAAIMGGKK
ncbi:MAG TPA: 50S ribosomal protein L18 [Nitrososphaerales archaeon]|nr:50S ribosomal protein L18 [Nitrososphaerales archaeon]